MIPRGIARRYAVALFSAAMKAGLADKVNGDAVSVGALFKENPSLKNFLLSPQVLEATKKDVIRSVLKGKVTELFAEFLILLIDKKRFSSVEEIANGYTHFYERHHGIIDVQAITAVPLDQRLHRKTVETLEQKTGKKVKLNAVVDERIIGGMILILDDKIVDGSIRFRLQKLRRELEAIRV
jgi:F-type H+-transporting ATPase subunit delta